MSLFKITLLTLAVGIMGVAAGCSQSGNTNANATVNVNKAPANTNAAAAAPAVDTSVADSEPAGSPTQV